MEALKLKIFEALTGKIPVTDFEKWLFNTDEFIKKLNSNTFYFDIISINYKSDQWASKLNNLVIKHLESDCLLFLEIEKSCLSIIDSETFQEIHKILTVITEDFDYDTDYSILWKFYCLKDYFDLVEEGFHKKGTLELEAKFYSTQTLEILENFKDFETLKSDLKENLKPFETLKQSQKQSIKTKFLAFFKKI